MVVNVGYKEVIFIKMFKYLFDFDSEDESNEFDNDNNLDLYNRGDILLNWAAYSYNCYI